MEYPPCGYPDADEITKRYPSVERDIWKPDPNSCEPVIMANQFDLVKTCYAEGIPLGFYACPMAARQGNIEMLQWLVDNGGNFPLRMCMIAAARGGHIMTIQWLMEHYDGQLNGDMIRAAIHRGDITLLEHLVGIGCPFNDPWYLLFREAAEVGFIDGMEFIRGACADQVPTGYSMQLAVRAAASKGQFAAVKWILDWQSESEFSFIIRRFALMGALRAGNHEIAQYVYDLNPTPSAFCERAMAWVIGHDDHDTINVLEWMAARGCAITGIYSAIYSGRIDVIQWMRAHGLQMHDVICTKTMVHAKHDEDAMGVLQYLHSGDSSTHPCAMYPCHYAVHGVPMVHNEPNSECGCCAPDHCWCCNESNDHYAMN